MLKIYKVQAIIQLDRGTKQSYKKSYIYKAELNLYLNEHCLPLQQHRRNYLHERSFAATKYVHLVLNYKRNVFESLFNQRHATIWVLVSTIDCAWEIFAICFSTGDLSLL